MKQVLKYRLKKDYPNSPKKIGTIITKNGSWWQTPFGERQDCILHFHEKNFNPELYPDNWEKITEDNQIEKISLEKDYQIMSYYSTSLSKEGNFHVQNASCFKDSQFVGNNEWSIYSVKRLSDGEIFTIGDKTHLTNGNYYNFQLKEFRFFNNSRRGHLEKHRNKTFLKPGIVYNLHKEPIFFYFEDIVKTKLPLFTTEDGFEIFEGDDYWVYDYGELKDTSSEIHKVNRASQTHTGNGVNRKYFSTKENTEHYVIMNKPCLSITDIIKYHDGLASNTVMLLKEFVKKSKLSV